MPLKMLRGFFIIKYIKNQIKNIPKKYIKKTKYSENSVDIKKVHAIIKIFQRRSNLRKLK